MTESVQGSITALRAPAPRCRSLLEKDFYTQDDVPEGEDPQVVENLFAEFEANAATVLRELSQNRTMPNEREQFDTIMNFIALAATRVPTMRDLISRPMEDICSKDSDDHGVGRRKASNNRSRAPRRGGSD